MPVGLDYNVLPMLMKMYGVKRKERLATLRSIQIMESAALEQMSEDRKSRK